MLPIFTIVINVALILFFLRFVMQLADLDRFNPVVMAANKATLIVDLLGKAIPTVAKGRVNLACLLIVVILYLVKIVGLAQLLHEPIYSPVHLLFLTLIKMVFDLLNFCHYIILGSIIASLIMALSQSSSPILQVLNDLGEPIFAPFRKIIPNLGMFDLSPIAAILALSFVESVMEVIAKNLLAGF